MTQRPEILELSDTEMVSGMVRARIAIQGERARALVTEWNLLEEKSVEDLQSEMREAIVLWSGWVGEREPSGVFPLSPKTWSPDAWAELVESCARMSGGEAGSIWFRPHARHVLSDAQRCRTLMKEWKAAGGEATPFRMLMEPAALMTPSMLGAAADHVARAIEAVADMPELLAGILVSDIALVERSDEPEPATKPVAFGRGAIGHDTFVEGVHLAGGWPGGVPLVRTADARDVEDLFAK
ncbi:MAG: hypothetical protein AAGI17_11085 [Planctomycetota bacterium]